jgi:hypothetical protein
MCFSRRGERFFLISLVGNREDSNLIDSSDWKVYHMETSLASRLGTAHREVAVHARLPEYNGGCLPKQPSKEGSRGAFTRTKWKARLADSPDASPF